jgi:simple sugar transport system substrate-binding protein
MHRPRPPAALAAAAALLLTAACSSQGGRQDEADPDVATPDLTIALITHQAPGDTFWDIVRGGAEDAAAKSGVTLEYSADPEGARQAVLVQTAVDSGVDGIAVTLAKPDALQGALDAAAEAGIPVVGLNSGIDQWRDAGLMAYYGTDEDLAGEAYGERLNESGAAKALCVVHEQGNVGLEARCAGMAESFGGDTETLYVDGANMPEVKAALTARLQEDRDVDHVAALGAPFALTAVDAVADAGSDAAVATFDTNRDLVAAIEEGTVEWAVDQQPYLQGYLAVDGLWLYATNGNVTGGGAEPVLTGPSFVDRENIDEVAAYAESGTR